MWELNLCYFLILYLICVCFENFRNAAQCNAEKIRYISTEHPNVTEINTKYIKSMNLTSQRYGRANPFYYVGFHMETAVTFNNNVSVDFYIYEYLSNVYKRSFVEWHFEICHMVQHDPFFGAPMRQGQYAKPCPHPPGRYHFYNMSIDIRVIPSSFPFRKGRIFAYMHSRDTKEFMARGHIDMEVKEVNIKRKKPKKPKLN